MKKALYIILLLAELVGGFILLTLVSGGAMGFTFFGVVAAVWAVLAALLLVLCSVRPLAATPRPLCLAWRQARPSVLFPALASAT